MANLDTMRRYLTPDEDTSVGAMDATTPEEADAALAGVSVPEWRDLAKPEKGPMAALDRATFAARNPIGPPSSEENDVRLVGMSLRDWRDLAKPEKGPMAALDRATFTARNPMGPPIPQALNITSPIPVAGTPVKADVPEATKGAIAATTPTQPAPPAGTSSTVKPPPVGTENAGGDDELGRLSMGQALVRALEGSGSVISGQNLRSGAADTLGERMKQIEALRAKKLQTAEERALEASTWGASNRSTLASALAQWKGDPEKTAALEALASGADTTKPGDFSRNVVNAVMTKPKVLGAEAGVGKTVAQTGAATATAAAVPKKLEQGEKKLAETAAENLRRDAREWARIRAAADAAATKAAGGQPEAVQKEVRATTQKLGDAVAKEYGEISSALKEADRSLVAVKNQPPDVFAKVMQATNLDSLNTPEERALFRSVGELRRAAQKAQSGLAVTENERAEFLQLFGANWLQSPSSLLEAIEWMRRKTKDKLDQSFATYRAQGSVGNTAVRAYREAGGVTPDADFLLPFTERQAKTAAPKAGAAGAPAAVAGRTRMIGTDGNKYDVPNDRVAAAKAKGWKEQ